MIMADFFRKALQRSVKYWVIVAITVSICYGFTLTNASIGVDDERFYYNFHGHGLLAQGRYFSFYFKYILDTYEFLPFWRDGLGLILHVLGTALLAHSFSSLGKKCWSEAQIIIFSCLMLSFSYLAELQIFMMAVFEIGFQTIISALLLQCFIQVIYKKGNSWIIAFFITALLSVVMGEATTIHAFTCVALGIFIYYLSYPDNAKLRHVFRVVAMVGGTYAICFFIHVMLRQATMAINNVTPDEYLMNYISYDTSSFLSFSRSFASYLIHFPRTFWNLCIMNREMSLYGIAMLIEIVAGFSIAIKHKRAVFFLLAIVAAFTPIGLFFITGRVIAMPRSMINLRIPIGLAGALVAGYLYPIRIRKFNIKYLFYLLIVLVVFQQSKTMNRVFYTDYLRYQYDKNIMESLVVDLRAEQNGKLDKPVVFVGTVQEPDMPKGEVWGHSLINFVREVSLYYELSSVRIKDFFQAHGYTISIYANPEIDEIANKAQHMKSWPASGYIIDCGDYLLVKLGDSKWLPLTDSEEPK